MGSPNQREEEGEALMVHVGRRKGREAAEPSLPADPKGYRRHSQGWREQDMVRPWQYFGSLNMCLEKLIFPWITPAKLSQHQQNTNN